MGLMPFMLNAFAIKGDGEGFVKHHGLDCIECGSCSYECPAKRQLAQSHQSDKENRSRQEGSSRCSSKSKSRG